jgi:predicted XRE-type DNA-binding protein
LPGAGGLSFAAIFKGLFASKPAPTLECISTSGSGLAREGVRTAATNYRNKIIVRLDVVMATQKIRSKELASLLGITAANLSLLKNGKVRA